MRYLFFLVLLANVLLLLWQFQQGKLMPQAYENNGRVTTQLQQDILLVNEWQAANQENTTAVTSTSANSSAQKIQNLSKETSLQQQFRDEIIATIPSSLSSTAAVNQPDFTSEQIVLAEKPEGSEPKGREVDQLNAIEMEIVDESATVIQEQSVAESAEHITKSYCVQFGPLSDMQGFIKWLNSLSFKATHFKQFNQEEQVISSYLVYYPAAETYAASKANLKLLQEQGQTDLWLFRKGDMRGAISLGLFSQQSRALRIKEKLIKQGIAVEMRPRYKTVKQDFAKLKWRITEQDIKQILESWQQTQPGEDFKLLPDCTTL